MRSLALVGTLRVPDTPARQHRSRVDEFSPGAATTSRARLDGPPLPIETLKTFRHLPR